MANSSNDSRPRLVSEWFRTRCRPLTLVLGASMLMSGVPAPRSLAFGDEPLTFEQKLMNPRKGAFWERTPTDAAKPPKKQSLPKQTQPQTDPVLVEEESQVKLNYLSASWEKVLRDVAEATGSVLVADRVPAGRFNRRDGAQYTRSEAVRIINHEMEPLGFRLIEKGEFLIVIDLPSQRVRYQTPIVPKPTNETPKTDAYDPPPAAPKQKVTKITPAPRNAPQQPRNAAASGIQLASHEQPAETAAPRRHPLDPASNPAANDPVTVAVFRPVNHSVNDLAKRVYRTFKDRADLVESGRNDLPAFRARTAGANSAPTLFMLSIDEERGELLIDAHTSQADGLVKLLNRLDEPENDKQPIQLVSSTKTVCEVGPQLPAQFAKLRVALEKEAAKRGVDVAQVAQPQLPNAGQPAAGEERPTTVQDVISGIKSPVNIEAIPDLGVLILSGSEKDVRQIQDLIKQLEKLSEATAPKVHLLYLRYVDSEALAQLLTTVYETLTRFPGKATQPRQSVAILPVVSPNAIIIVAPAGDLESIKELADQLDEPVEPESEFQVFPLQSAIATSVAEKLTTMTADPKGLGMRVAIQAEERTNSIIVRGKPRDLDRLAVVIQKIDHEDLGSTSTVRVFRLTNAIASEMAAIINAAIQSVLSPPSNPGASQILGQGFGGGGGGAGQVAEDFRTVRPAMLKFLSTTPEGERLMKSGILADIRITADPRINSLIVAAPETSLGLVGELIRALDVPTEMVAEIKVFTLQNADAQVMVQQLQGLFNAQVTGGQGQGGAAGQQRQQLGVQLVDAEDAASGLIPLKFSIDTRTNSVIAIGSGDALRVVEAIMLRLDESDLRARKTTTYRLKNTPSTNIAQSVTTFFTNQQNILNQDQNLFSTIEQLEREVVVVAEPVSNNLLVSATPRYYDDLIKLIEKLDAAPQQVIMQALIVEVTLQDTDEFGVELGFQDSVLFNRSLVDAANTFTTTTSVQAPNGNTTSTTNIISEATTPGFAFANPSTLLGNNTGGAKSAPNLVGSQGLSNFSLGRVNGDLGFGGLVLTASSQSVSALLRALAQNRQVRVLSRPQVRAMDNQIAYIQQGQIVPVVTGVNNAGAAAGTAANPTVTRDNAGVILQVTPRISPDGNVVMAIMAEKSVYQLGAGNGVPIYVNAATGSTVTAPIKDISQATTTISVPNGQTVILGGLITSSTTQIHRRVPWLGDIPVVGWAFRYDYIQTQRTELLIFLTPRIISDSAYSEHVKEVEMARIHYVECEAEEIHGPLRGVPASELFEGQLLTPQGMPPGSNAAPGTMNPMPPAPRLVVPRPSPDGSSTPPAAADADAPASDSQVTPANAYTPATTSDRRVIHAAMDQPSSVKINKSKASAAAPNASLGKDQQEKKPWYSFNRKTE